MRKKDIALNAVNALKKEYPDASCSLNYGSAFQLLVATRLSAQCTDARVNLVTPELFKIYPTADKMALAKAEQIEKLIHSCGLYKTKAANLVEMSGQIMENFGGNVPDTIDKLITLSGIGRKTANLIMGDIYNKPAIVTDTHLIRISNRLGLVSTKNPIKTEKELVALIPPEESSDFCHRVVLLGRDICKAQNPKCQICPLSSFCKNKIS